MLKTFEVCAGVGGQALGLERAGFTPTMLLDNDLDSCETLRANRPQWDIQQMDLRHFVGAEHPKVLDTDLLVGGVPCTPFSVAGRQQGAKDDRNLLETLIWLASEVQPKAIMVENVPALLKELRFAETRQFVRTELAHLGYRIEWEILHSERLGVSQRRPHSILVALKKKYSDRFRWPVPTEPPPPVGEVLRDSMAAGGWPGADRWARNADELAPTIVGGSKKHGGADLGPTGAKNAWQRLGINGGSLADEPPTPDFELTHGLGPRGRNGLPKLTIAQVALLQGFPESWVVTGRKTSRYRQVAQALPPPAAEAVGRRIVEALGG